MRAAASSPCSRSPGSRPSSGSWASEVFSGHLTQGGDVEHRLCEELFELAVLFLERLQLAGVGGLHPAVLRSPRVEGRITDPACGTSASRGSPLRAPSGSR